MAFRSTSQPDDDLVIAASRNTIYSRLFLSSGYDDALQGPGVGPRIAWLYPNATSTNVAVGIGQRDSTGNRTLVGLLSVMNTTTGVYTFNGSGASCWSGSWNTTSDLKLKKDIVTCPYGLNEIIQLNPCLYTFKHDEEHKMGFIAQEMLHVISEAVGESDQQDDDENPVMMGIDYTSLTAPIIKAIQELNEKIIKLEERLSLI